MFGKRCTLCGGKLDSNGICKECGLDNKKNDKNYRVNQSSCDGQPLTHVHTEETKPPVKERMQKASGNKASGGRMQTGPSQSYRPPVYQPAPGSGQKVRKKRGCIGWISIIIVVIVVLNVIGDTVIPLIQEKIAGKTDEGYSYEESYEVDDRDPYESITKGIPETGESAEYTLTSGLYIVGVHIPEGVYQAETEDEFDVVSVHNSELNLYLYEYEGKDGENYLDDLRLYEGSQVEIDARGPVVLRTQNAQFPIENMANPLTESYTLTGTSEAGGEFLPGVYDMELKEGSGEIVVEIYDEQGELWEQRNYYLADDGYGGTGYCNLVLPEHAVVTCGEGVTISLTPSETIKDTDYFAFYEIY